MDSIASVSPSGPEPATAAPGHTRVARRLLLAVAIVLAFAFRIAGIGSHGLSEDEAAKLVAVDAYRHGDFTANAEHPMLMKLAVWASLGASGSWNRVAPDRTSISEETAVRLPNVLAGTALVAVVYGVVELLFTPAAAVLAAFIVALDPNVTALNRLGKEDTFLVLFLLLGVFCYERGKRQGAGDPEGAQAWYGASGASFGLMLASKYLPHLFGIHAAFNVAAMPNPGANKPRKALYYGLLLAAFLAADFAIFLPATWAYCLAYLQGDHSTHHGYMYAGKLYVNSATVILHGVPVTYYLNLVASKTPLPVLAGAGLGMIPMVTRRRERGFIWLRVFLVLTLIGYSMFAAKFQRYALSILVLVDILAAVGLLWLANRLADQFLSNEPGTRNDVSDARHPGLRAGRFDRRRGAMAAAPAVIIVCVLGAAQVRAMPFYSTFQNAIGAALAPPLSVFPEEAYDYGVREAVAAIAAAASSGATITSDAPIAVRHYLMRVNRQDLHVRSLSEQGLAAQGEQWVIVQDGHIYFENALLVEQLRRTEPPWRDYRIRGTKVLEVFRVTR